MAKYVDVAYLKTMWVSGSTAKLTEILEISENILDNLVWDRLIVYSSNWNWSWNANEIPDITEAFKDKYNKTSINLKYLNIDSIVSVNGTDIEATDYYIQWQTAYFKTSVSSVSDFPNLLTIVYKAWFSEAPDDIKLAIVKIASYLTTKEKAWINRFKQDLLEVEYSGTDDDFKKFLKEISITLLNKYKVKYVYTL